MLAPRDDDEVTDNTEPGHQYRGYLVDVLEALAKHASFTYSLHAVHDGQRGSRQHDGTWTGLVGELIVGNASLALGPLLITPEKYEVIDFTQVFQVARLSAVIRRGSDSYQSLVGGPLQFVRPLSGSVWTLIGVVFVSTTILLYTVDRLDVRTYPPPAAELTGAPVAARLGLAQSAVCALTTMMLMTRYSPVTTSSSTPSVTATEPRSAAGRLTVAALWGFSLIIIASYTANMAAMMATARLPASTGSAGDTILRRTLLSELSSGRLQLAASASSVDDVRALLFSGSDDVTADVTEPFDDVEEGIRSSVERSNSAFLSDSEVLRYHLHRLQSAADHLIKDIVALHSSTDGAGYAIGVRKGFAHTTRLNLALARLAKDGTLRALRRKWLSGDTLMQSDLQAGVSAGSLSLYDLGGPFLLLAAVVSALLAASVVRHCIRRRRASLNRLPGAKLRTSENHVGYKPTTTTTALAAGTSMSTSGTAERGTLIQCNSSGVPYDMERIEQFTDTVSLPVSGLDTPRTRSQAAGILRHKETNF